MSRKYPSATGEAAVANWVNMTVVPAAVTAVSVTDNANVAGCAAPSAHTRTLIEVPDTMIRMYCALVDTGTANVPRAVDVVPTCLNRVPVVLFAASSTRYCPVADNRVCTTSFVAFVVAVNRYLSVMSLSADAGAFDVMVGLGPDADAATASSLF
jgi:hypothetical protein